MKIMETRTSRPKERIRAIVSLAVLVGISSLPIRGAFLPAAGQETDPFYRKQLENGEASLAEKKYEEAIRSLEIAVFGLFKDKTLQARAYVFLALSLAASGRKEKSAEALSAAAGLIGWDGLPALNVRDGTKSELEKLIAGIRKSPAEKPEPPPASEKKPAAEKPPVPAPAGAGNDVDRLLETIKADPKDEKAYYALAARQRENQDIAGARKTLETLLSRIPAEIRAYLEIGRLEYQARNLKSAERSLERFLSLSGNVPVDVGATDEARALLLLSAKLRGDEKKVRRIIPEAEGLLQPGRFSNLSHEAADKDRLQAILAAGKK